MNPFKFLNILVYVLLLLTSTITNAASMWQIVPDKSSITFTATQNNAPVSGEFKSFTGDIDFDSLQLDKSHVTIRVDTNSVSTSYADIANTLKTADWFNVTSFPQAIFKANAFTKTGNTTYQAQGTLTLRDKTLPITLTFTLVEYTTTQAKVTGTATIKRTAFGVGKGDFAKTDQVKDDVVVNFTLLTNKK